MEGAVRGVFERGGGEAFVVVDGAVADELHLWDAGDRFEERVEDGLLVVLGRVVAVAVVLGGGVERLLCVRRDRYVGWVRVTVPSSTDTAAPV